MRVRLLITVLSLTALMLAVSPAEAHDRSSKTSFTNADLPRATSVSVLGTLRIDGRPSAEHVMPTKKAHTKAAHSDVVETQGADRSYLWIPTWTVCAKSDPHCGRMGYKPTRRPYEIVE